MEKGIATVLQGTPGISGDSQRDRARRDSRKGLIDPGDSDAYPFKGLFYRYTYYV